MIITVNLQNNWKEDINAYLRGIRNGDFVLEDTELRFGESLRLIREHDGSGYTASGNSRGTQERMLIGFHQILTVGGRSIYIESMLDSFVARNEITLLNIELAEQNLQLVLWKRPNGLCVWTENLATRQSVREIPEQQTA